MRRDAQTRSGRTQPLAIRVILAAVRSLLVLQLIPGSSAAPADVLGFALWFALTGSSDLASPPER